MFGGSKFIISIFLGVLGKNDYFFGLEIFVDIFGGHILILTIFMGYFFKKINYCNYLNLCSVMKFTITQTTHVNIHNGHGI